MCIDVCVLMYVCLCVCGGGGEGCICHIFVSYSLGPLRTGKAISSISRIYYFDREGATDIAVPRK